MKCWLVALSFIALSVSTVGQKISCLTPCAFRQDLSSPYVNSVTCPKSYRKGVHCEANIQFDYSNKIISISRIVHEELLSDINLNTLPLTRFEATIELNSFDVSTSIRHFCKHDRDCSEMYLSQTVDKYRMYSHETLLNNLRQLLIRNGARAIFSWPITCLRQRAMQTVCLTGKCQAQILPVAGIELLGCSVTDTINNFLTIVTPDTKRWNIFSVNFECAWSMCNNDDLANDIRKMIIKFYQPSNDQLTENPTMSPDDLNNK